MIDWCCVIVQIGITGAPISRWQFLLRALCIWDWGSVLYMPVQKNQYPNWMMLWVQLVTALQLHWDICGYLGGQSEGAAVWTFELHWQHQYDFLVCHPCLLSLRAQCSGLKGICYFHIENQISCLFSKMDWNSKSSPSIFVDMRLKRLKRSPPHAHSTVKWNNYKLWIDTCALSVIDQTCSSWARVSPYQLLFTYLLQLLPTVSISQHNRQKWARVF